MKRKRERARNSVTPVITLGKELPIGSTITHKIGTTTFKAEVVKSERCKGCLAMEGTSSECARLWAKAGSCFAHEREDKTEVSFILHRKHFGTHHGQEEEDDE